MAPLNRWASPKSETGLRVSKWCNNQQSMVKLIYCGAHELISGPLKKIGITYGFDACNLFRPPPPPPDVVGVVRGFDYRTSVTWPTHTSIHDVTTKYQNPAEPRRLSICNLFFTKPSYSHDNLRRVSKSPLLHPFTRCRSGTAIRLTCHEGHLSWFK